MSSSRGTSKRRKDTGDGSGVETPTVDTPSELAGLAVGDTVILRRLHNGPRVVRSKARVEALSPEGVATLAVKSPDGSVRRFERVPRYSRDGALPTDFRCPSYAPIGDPLLRFRD